MKKIKIISLGIIATMIISLSGMSTAHAYAADKDFVAENVKYKDLQKWPDSTLSTSEWGYLRLYMYHVETPLTNPCPNCKFIVKPWDTDGNMGLGLPFKEGDDKTFPASSGLGRPATYILGGTREDWTLTNLGTKILGWFCIDPNN